MNLRIAISSFNDFRIDIDELVEITTPTEHEVDALHKRCQSLINTFYGGNKWVNTFQKDIEVLIINKDNDAFETRFHRLRLLVENIRQDLYLKQRMEDEAKEIVEDEKQKKIDEYLGQIVAYQRNQEGHTARMERLRTQLASCKKEIDSLKDSYQKEIDRLKRSYQEQIDALRNQPRPKTYKAHFYISLGILLTFLNFGIPFLIGTVVWKEIIWLEIAIVATVIVLYFREVPKWIEFLAMILLTILIAIFLGK